MYRWRVSFRIFILLLALCCRMLDPITTLPGLPEAHDTQSQRLNTAPNPEGSAPCWAPRTANTRFLIETAGHDLGVPPVPGLEAVKQRAFSHIASTQPELTARKQIYPSRRWRQSAGSPAVSDPA